jgi:hypothetical protein
VGGVSERKRAGVVRGLSDKRVRGGGGSRLESVWEGKF